MTTTGSPQEYDMVSWGNRGDARSNALYHSGAFMPEDRRQRRRLHTTSDREIAVTDPGCDHAHKHLVLMRLLDLDLLNHQGSAGLVEDGAPHRAATSLG
jgi:hypothetical protein